MYFRDKEELFQYLVRESTEPLLLAFRELLTRSGGDLFDAIPGLCEYLQSHKADRGLGGMGMLSAIVEPERRTAKKLPDRFSGYPSGAGAACCRREPGPAGYLGGI